MLLFGEVVSIFSPCKINATEPDTGLTTGISYSIVAGSNNRFSIDSTGVITTTAELDREEVARYGAYCGGQGHAHQWELSRFLCPGGGVWCIM